MKAFDIGLLEFEKVAGLVSAHAVCAEAKQRLLELAPGGDYTDATRLLTDTDEAVSILRKLSSPPICGVVNVAAAVKRAGLGGVLSLKELLRCADLLRVMGEVIRYRDKWDMGSLQLDRFFDRLYENRPLEKNIQDSVLSPEEVADTASPELYAIRKKILRLEENIRVRLENMLRSPSTSLFLQEPIITIRDGRFVLPVKSEHRAKISGLVHDSSGSGATLFIEPMAVVEMNNNIRELRGEENEEIERIIAELSAAVGQCADSMSDGYEALLSLDMVFAKARYAYECKGTKPILTKSVLQLKKARHPLIDKQKVVPIDVSLGDEYTTLVVTGPNTGGKTVCLKTMGLLSVMAQCGLFIPAEEGSHVPVYGSILVDIGDEQSIEQSLSTFSGHMKNIVSILERADRGSLVLVDELGAGTDPTEGAALAVSILETLRRQGACVAATTHYAEIKQYALSTTGVENASCEFDVESLRPTYRLIVGVPGRSNAFAIAKKLGLPDAVIDSAKATLSGESSRFETVVDVLEDKRTQYENELQQVEEDRKAAQRLKEESAERRRKAEEQAERILKEARRQAEKIVDDIRSEAMLLKEEMDDIRRQGRQQQGDAAARARELLRNSLRGLEQKADPIHEPDRDEEYVLPRDPEEGDSVLIMTLGQKGRVDSVNKKQRTVMVTAGALKTRVGWDSIKLLPKAKKKQTGGYRNVKPKLTQNLKTEVDLRGMTVEEGIMEVDRFLSSSITTGIEQVTIIHGVGTGALRDGIRNHLKGLKYIKSFRRGIYGEGEDGVTVVTFQ